VARKRQQALDFLLLSSGPPCVWERDAPAAAAAAAAAAGAGQAEQGRTPEGAEGGTSARSPGGVGVRGGGGAGVDPGAGAAAEALAQELSLARGARLSGEELRSWGDDNGIPAALLT
jgi:hypothetical protein